MEQPKKTKPSPSRSHGAYKCICHICTNCTSLVPAYGTYCADCIAAGHSSLAAV